MKIAILGYGEQGRSAYDYWRGDGNELTVCDSNEQLHLPSDVATQLGPNYLDNLNDFDLIVRSPIIHPRQLIDASGADIIKKVTTVTNEFFKVSPTKNIICVTGTKGKGTTSTLITLMLRAAGYRVHLGGNIGTPPLDLLKENITSSDWVVLELANFQLIDLHYSPHIGVCLMVVPEHLNWHSDMNEYIHAKQQLFAHQNSSDIAVYFASSKNSKQVAAVGNGLKLPYYSEPGAVVRGNQITIDGQSICPVSDLKLLGQHNWQNICAALTASWQVVQNTASFRQVLTTFSGLEHRLEFVRELKGVKYYDDSFGTTPETAIVALQAFSKPIVIVLGGSDKGSSYSDLAKIVREAKVRTVVLIGETGPAIKTALLEVGFTNIIDGGRKMTDIVAAAESVAKSGDIVLLSTACASFDLFHDYKDRGNQFKSAVKELA